MTTSVPNSSSAPSSNGSTTVQDMTLSGVGNLIRLLPTGTVFLFEFLNPVITENGNCSTPNKALSAILIAFCGLLCALSCFTDSYTDSKGNLRYGIATRKGLWTSSSSSSSSSSKSEESDNDDHVDKSKYKIGVADFVYAGFSMIVFGAVALLDANSVQCFYPSFESTQKVLLSVLPAVIGTTAAVVFVLFPHTRHGIGYPAATASSASATSTEASA